MGGRSRILLHFPYDERIIDQVRSIPGRVWDVSGRCWHVPDDVDSRRHLRDKFGLEVPAADSGTDREGGGPSSHGQSNNVHGNRIRVAMESERWLKVYVPREEKEWIRRVKEVPGRHWDWERKYWRIPYVAESLGILRRRFPSGELVFEFAPWHNIPEKYVRPVKTGATGRKRKATSGNKSGKVLNKAQRDAVILLEEQLRLRRYSHSTVKTYKSLFSSFLLHYSGCRPEEITGAQIKDYVLHLIRKKNISESTQNQVINAVKFYYEKVLNQERKTYYVQRPKKSKPLPEVLSEPDVVRILNACENIKHKCILILVYSAGLRLSEVVNLKVWDIHYDRRQVFIKGGKGKKDRYTILSEAAIAPLRKYTEQYRPDDWLFEGQYGGQYSKRSVQQVFKRALKKSGVTQRATLHTLRHSFATHLLEKGVNLRYIQELLGHHSSKTTEIYTHITKKGIEGVKSPLDYLDLGGVA